MKFTVEIEGEQRALDVRREGERVFAEVDDRRYAFTVREAGAGTYILLADDNRVYECRVDNLNTPGDTVNVSVNDRPAYGIQINDTRRLRRGDVNAQAQGGGQSKITAAMPGKVVRVLAEAGARVEAGDPVIVVEAMKMQNEMKAPRAGRVAAIHAQAGATVGAGDVLVIIE